MAVRKIPKNYRNVTGRNARGRGTAPAEFESLLERDYLILLDFDPEVASFETQPIHVRVPGNKRPYTPDVLVHYRPNHRGQRRATELIEVKPSDKLAKYKAELAPKFKAARALAHENGWKFAIRTEKHIRTPRLENAKFLRGYKNHEPTESERDHLLQALARLGGRTTSSQLIHNLDSGLEEQGAWYTVLWFLVLSRQVLVDYDTTFSRDVTVWLQMDET